MPNILLSMTTEIYARENDVVYALGNGSVKHALGYKFYRL